MRSEKLEVRNGMAVAVQPVLQMVSSDFEGRKEDAATLRREERMLIRALLAPWTRKNPSPIRQHL